MNNKVYSTINHKEMKTSNTSNLREMGSSLIHVVIYVAMLCLISTAVSGQDPCDDLTMACSNNINISTNHECIAVISQGLLMSGIHDGYLESDYTITITDEDGNSLGLTANADGSYTVGDSEVGMKLKVSVTLDPCGISCWGYVNVEDKVGPTFLHCPNGIKDPVVVPCDDGFNVSPPGLAAGCDAATDVTFTDENLGVTCVGDYSGEVIRTWSAADPSGNITVCTQRLLVERFDVADVIFPPNFIFDIDPTDCDNIPSTDPATTGEPTGLSCPNLMYFHTDIGTETCGKQVKMIRDWFIIDWCTGISAQKGQVIKIRDISPPVTNCPPDTLRYPSLPLSCSAYVTLDPFAVVDSSSAPVLVDDCSEPLTIEVAYLPAIAGTDQPVNGPYITVAMGQDSLFAIPSLIEKAAWVRYCYTDACGNSVELNEDDPDNPVAPADYTNCCFFEIQIEDNNPPNAICEGFTKIPVGSGGETIVPAERFDDHSYDPCGSIENFEVRRESPGCGGNTFYGPSVSFCCEDLGDTVTVILKVTDGNGNTSECPSRVCVTDDFIPSFDCPDDVTIDCIDSYEDLTTATGTIGCSQTYTIDDGTFDLSGFDSACSTGSIIRMISIRDLAGDVIDSCEQKITVIPMGTTTQLQVGDYDFPDDIMMDQCDPLFSLDPAQTGIPTTNKEYGCINIGISYEDGPPVVSNTDGVCFTILRTWTIVDWCRFDSSDPGQYAIYGTQSIIIMNDGAPTLTCPDMLMTSTTDANCMGHIDIDVAVSDNCVGSTLLWSLDADTDGIVDLNGTGTNASGTYPVGSHSITYTITNECGGGTADCTFPVIIKGDRPPLPICLASITWTLSENGVAVVWASDFDLKSEGGCDGMDTLTFSFVAPTDVNYPESSRTFTCDDLPNGGFEMITLEVFIIDENGVYESCTVTLDLQDTHDVCPDVGSLFSSVGGEIMTETAQGLENVMVGLDNMTDVTSSMNMTDNSGSYAFPVVSNYDAYSIKPDHDVDHLNGISTLDLVKIQRHILDIEALDSPYKIIAADVNADEAVDGVDLIELRKLILGIYAQLPQNDSWVFVPEAYQFVDPTTPWGYDTDIDIDALYTPQMDMDFIAVKVGDVNADVQVYAIGDDEVSSRNASFFLSSEDVHFQSGDLVAVPMEVEEGIELSGLQLTMEFDPSTFLFVGVDKDALEINEGNFALLNDHPGTLTFSIADANGISLELKDNLLTVYFEAKSDGVLSEVVKISDKVVRSEVYVGVDETRPVDYLFKANTSGTEFEVFQNQPNPFSSETSIAFFTPQSDEVRLEVYNAEGKLILTKKGQFNKGLNEFWIDADELNAQGILIYKLETAKTSITNRMILVR